MSNASPTASNESIGYVTQATNVTVGYARCSTDGSAPFLDSFDLSYVLMRDFEIMLSRTVSFKLIKD